MTLLRSHWAFFYERFKDFKNNVKELFLDIDTTFLIPSVAIVVIEEAIEVQNIGAPIEMLPLTTFEATTIAKASEAHGDAQPKAQTNQVVEVRELFILSFHFSSYIYVFSHWKFKKLYL